MKYAVVIEKGKESYGAYVPDLPGCIAVGETEEEVKNLSMKQLNFTWKDSRKMVSQSRS